MVGVDNTQKKLITILSIDGGGIRGVIPAYILGKLEALIREKDGRKDARIAEYFDIVAGTSTGSILTALITAPDANNKRRPAHDASEFVDFYKKSGPKIFAKLFSMEFLKSKLKQIINIYGDIYKLVKDEKTNLVYGYLKYYSLTDTKNLHDEVDNHLRDVKLSDTVTNVVIPSFRISKAMPLIFTNHVEEHEDSKNTDIALRDAILSSAAAPAYFPPHLFTFRTKEEMFFDGGLGANNPSLAALCEATYTYGNEKDYSNYLVLSLGTGQRELPGKSQSQTFTKWLLYQIKSALGIDFIMQTVNNTVDFQMSRIFHKHPQNYLRIEKYGLTKDQADMCNGKLSHIEELEDIAEKLLYNEKVNVVDPHTGTKMETEERYIDALKEFAEILVEEKRRRDNAKGKLAA